jgi:L-iditol 2-dehydrogenase
MQGKVAALVAAERVEVKRFDVPRPGPGAVVARVRRANVCGSEIHIWHFHHPLIRSSVLGHEFVAEIEELGEGVTTDYAGQPVGPGDRIVAPYWLTCRRCPACLRGDFNLCQSAYALWSQPPERDPHFTGAFGTHYYVHPWQYFYKVPDAIGDRAVAGANCGLTQVLFGLDKAGLRAGDTVLVQGAGGLGLYACAVARDAGARVILVDGVEQRIEFARRFGAQNVVDMRVARTVEERVEAVRALTGDGPDMVLEVTGVPAAFGEALELVRPAGTVVEIGNVSVGPEHETSFSPGLITRKMIRVLGLVRYHPWYLHRALRFLERRGADHPFDELSDREYALEEVAEAIQRTERREVARPAIVPE